MDDHEADLMKILCSNPADSSVQVLLNSLVQILFKFYFQVFQAKLSMTEPKIRESVRKNPTNQPLTLVYTLPSQTGLPITSKTLLKCTKKVK